jgi:hypothetical protein
MHAVRFRVINSLLAIVVLMFAATCAAVPLAENRQVDTSPAEFPPSGFGEDVDRDVARIRASTQTFRSLDKAVAAGYSRNGGGCVDNPPEGAMGFHHQNAAPLDARLEVERPEMLVYERLRDGSYRLNGVEYIVPFSAWPQSKEPPMVMGQNWSRGEVVAAPAIRACRHHLHYGIEFFTRHRRSHGAQGTQG